MVKLRQLQLFKNNGYLLGLKTRGEKGLLKTEKPEKLRGWNL